MSLTKKISDKKVNFEFNKESYETENLLSFLYVRLKTRKNNETNKGSFVTIEADFRHLKDKNVSVIWKENSGRVIEIIESSIDFEMDNAFEISAHVEIEAGATRKETITLFTSKRD